MNNVCTDEIGHKILRDFCRGESVEDLCRRQGISREAFYRWRRIYRDKQKSKIFMQSDALHCVRAQDK